MKFSEYLIKEGSKSISATVKQSKNIERNYGFAPSTARIEKSKYNEDELMMSIDKNKNIFVSDPNNKHISKTDVNGQYDIISQEDINGVTWYRIL